MPLGLGSDKTTVSVATGQNDYYPLYLLLRDVSNAVRRAHRRAVVVLAFLADPKCIFYSIFRGDQLMLSIGDRQHSNDVRFRIFRRQLFHFSLSIILRSLREHMRKYCVMMYPDGHYRRTIYRRTIFRLGPYIADYPEQVILACVLTGWCAK